jgi:hypothetical protein
MRANAILRAAFLISAALFLNFSIAGRALGQDVGGDVGGASIFRARNPGPPPSRRRPANQERERLRVAQLRNESKTCLKRVTRRATHETSPSPKSHIKKC